MQPGHRLVLFLALVVLGCAPAGAECPPAAFDPEGRVANSAAAVGEIVNTEGTGFFEGYYKNDAATAARSRGGRYHSGDLGYRDAEGFVYFAGRGTDKTRAAERNQEILRQFRVRRHGGDGHQ